MSDEALSSVPLPSGWAENVKSAVLHVIFLANFAIAALFGCRNRPRFCRTKVAGSLQRTAICGGRLFRVWTVVGSGKRRPGSAVAAVAGWPAVGLYIPPWALNDSIELTVAGKAAKAEVKGSFLAIARTFAAGNVITLRFRQGSGAADLLDPRRMPGYHRYMHGPLVLGVDSKTEKALPPAEALEPLGGGCYKAKAAGMTLAPLCDLAIRRDDARRARSGAVQVLFKD